MSVLSKALRFAVIIGIVSGCATKSTPTADDYQALSETEAANSSEIAANETAGNQSGSDLVQREEIIAPVSGEVGVELERRASSTTLLISASVEDPQVEVRRIENPARIVIDFKGEKTSNKSVAISDSPVLKRVRAGAHSDKARLVLDLSSEGEVLEPVIESVDNNVALTFSHEPVFVKQTEVSSTEVEVAPVAAAEQAEITVEAVKFAKDSKEAGSVAIELTSAVAFHLKKTAPTEFTLTIPGTTAAERTLVPQIAPVGFPGIRSARAVQDGENTLVRMFVDSGVDVKAVALGKKIAIEAISEDQDAKNPEARAQLAPEQQEARLQVEVVEDEDAAQANPTGVVAADGSKVYTGRLISLDLQDTDIDNALRIIAEVSNLNIIASDEVTGKVTLRLIDVPWDQALDVILKTNGLDSVTEGNVIRIAPVEKLRQEREALRDAKIAKEQLEDLTVRYIRVSYARATDMREQIESVLTERGTVAVDERTNQLIVKDIGKGHAASLSLIAKLDLRTPQVLLETRIVEAQRNILRDLGFQWNFMYNESRETGNSTGLNFPNSVNVGGGTADLQGNSQTVNFPAAITPLAGSSIAAIFESADGSQLLSARLTALESEGRIRVVSRPQVATVNNRAAEIRSVETVRVRLPDSGLSVATGSGASAAGGGASAFEEIDVGIELRVTPQASPDYYVLLDVDASSSTFGSQEVDGIPSTFERQATSTILVKSGSTFALGGVYRINDIDRVQGVPFLKDIPFIGHFFRRTLTDKVDEELIFFITPHIVEGSFDEKLM